jgi:hypothetical protein
LSIGNYRFREGSGFDVVNGEIQRTFWIGELDSTTTIRRLVFTPGGFNPSLPIRSGINPNDICSVTVITTPSFTGSTPVFSPLQTPSGGPSSGPIHHTPNPLSVLAVAAGYQASRRLRRRIRQAANSRLL